MRERLADEVPDTRVLILDLEGERFFGAAPELEHIREEALQQAESRGAHALVLRLRRARNPDLVAVEIIEKFCVAAYRAGRAVLLAGVRPELLQLLQRSAQDAVPEHRSFAEEGEIHSATLKAIRAALVEAGQVHPHAPIDGREGRHNLV